MFLKKSVTTVKGKTYNHYKVVESYRDKGKVKHRILFSLGALTDEQAEHMRMVVRAHSDPDIVVSKAEDIVVTKHVSYLDIAVLEQIWQDWGFNEFFTGERWVRAMVFNRLLDPGSKISVNQWMAETAVPAYYSEDPSTKDPWDIYRELDRLFERESEIQSFIYERLKAKGPISQTFFYDITSTYLEGCRCILAAYGYSRDHRPDREQIVIALIITPEGYPIYWQVMPGNTQDVTTVQDIIKQVKARYGIDKCTMVIDRGMISKDNLLALEGGGWQYVSAMDRDEIENAPFFEEALPRAVLPEDYEQVMAAWGFAPFEQDGVLYFREFEEGKRRYILSFDVNRFLEERKRQGERLREGLDWIEEKNRTLSKAKKTKNKGVLEREIDSLLKRKHLKRFLKIQVEPTTHAVIAKTGRERSVQSFMLSYSIDRGLLQREQRLHGITCFITNLHKKDALAREVILWYRRKNKVEEAFHEIKSHLELRPVYLTRVKRVKAHVTVCVLSYFLFNDIERRLEDNDISRCPKNVLRLLGKCQINWLSFKAIDRTKLSITEPSTEQKEILRALGCEAAVSPGQAQKILKKAETYL
jgi:transposase